MNPSCIQSIYKMMEKSDRITIVTHTHPDGDAIGSSAGLLHYLRMKGKHPHIILSDRYPESLAFLIQDIKEDIFIFEENPEGTGSILGESDLLFCLDMNSYGRADALEPHLRQLSCPAILIDHHLNPEKESFHTVFSETDISSTSELLYHILLAMPDVDGDVGKLPHKTGTALLTGMTTDTNNFANSVYPSTFSMASDLIGAGIDRNAILDSLYNCYRENRFRLMGTLLADRMKITDKGVAYMIIDNAIAREYDIREGETEGFVNIPLGMKNVRMSLLLKEEEDRFRVSIRSKKGISANMCAARFFHGGGHELAAGGKLVKGQDISGGVEKLAAYVEKATDLFFTDENPAG